MSCVPWCSTDVQLPTTGQVELPHTRKVELSGNRRVQLSRTRKVQLSGTRKVLDVELFGCWQILETDAQLHVFQSDKKIVNVKVKVDSTHWPPCHQGRDAQVKANISEGLNISLSHRRHLRQTDFYVLIIFLAIDL